MNELKEAKKFFDDDRSLTPSELHKIKHDAAIKAWKTRKLHGFHIHTNLHEHPSEKAANSIASKLHKHIKSITKGHGIDWDITPGYSPDNQPEKHSFSFRKPINSKQADKIHSVASKLLGKHYKGVHDVTWSGSKKVKDYKGDSYHVNVRGHHTRHPLYQPSSEKGKVRSATHTKSKKTHHTFVHGAIQPDPGYEYHPSSGKIIKSPPSDFEY